MERNRVFLATALLVSFVLFRCCPATSAAETPSPSTDELFRALRTQLGSLDDVLSVAGLGLGGRRKRAAAAEGSDDEEFDDDDGGDGRAAAGTPSTSLSGAVAELERERRVMVDLGSELNHFNGGLKEAAEMKAEEVRVVEELASVRAEMEGLRSEMAQLRQSRPRDGGRDGDGGGGGGGDDGAPSGESNDAESTKSTVRWLTSAVTELQTAVKEFDDALNVTLLLQRKDETDRSTAVLEKSILGVRQELEEERARRLQDSEAIIQMRDELKRLASQGEESNRELNAVKDKMQHLESVVESLRGLAAGSHHGNGDVPLNPDAGSQSPTVAALDDPGVTSAPAAPAAQHTVPPPPPLSPMTEEELAQYFSDPRPSKQMHHHRHLKHEIALMQTVLEGLYNRQMGSDAVVAHLDDVVDNLSAVVLGRDPPPPPSPSDNSSSSSSTAVVPTAAGLAGRMDAVERRLSSSPSSSAAGSAGTEKDGAETMQAIAAVRTTTMTVARNLEGVESEMDAKFRQYRKEISKLEFNAAQISSSLDVLRQDQDELRKLTESVAAGENLLKKRMEADHFRLLSVSNQVLNMSLRSCQDDNREVLQDLKLARLETSMEQVKNKVEKHAGKFDDVELTVRNKIGPKQFAGVVTDTRGLAAKMDHLYRDILSNLGNIVEDLNNRTGPMLRSLPGDCEAVGARLPGVRLPDGEYAVRPGNMSRPVLAWCDFDDGGNDDDDDRGAGWTVIQRRTSGSVQFFRDWQDYKFGFGDAKGDHWIGNEALHHLTSSSSSTDRYSLRFELRDVDGNDYVADYAEFRVGPESDGFRLSVSGYAGNATDAFASHSGMRFSTPDADNDASSTHCAHYYQGGWWYSHCQYVNVNGRFDTGRTWYDADNHEWIQIVESVMKIRRVQNRVVEENDVSSSSSTSTTTSSTAAPTTTKTTTVPSKSVTPESNKVVRLQTPSPFVSSHDGGGGGGGLRTTEMLRDASDGDEEDDDDDVSSFFPDRR